MRILYFDRSGYAMWAKRLERGRFVWPGATDGVALLTPAQFAMLVEAIDWRAPDRTWWPEIEAA